MYKILSVCFHVIYGICHFNTDYLYAPESYGKWVMEKKKDPLLIEKSISHQEDWGQAEQLI